jgi:secondary thiamine-phosphate synthase enzyme
MESITVKTSRRCQFIDITREIAELVRKHTSAKAVLLYVPHTTAGITINENADPTVVQDILNHLEKMIPAGAHFRHTEGNSDAHIKSSLIGASILIPIEAGSLTLGTWQGIYFAEFDGPRTRKLYVQFL